MSGLFAETRNLFARTQKSDMSEQRQLNQDDEWLHRRFMWPILEIMASVIPLFLSVNRLCQLFFVGVQ